MRYLNPIGKKTWIAYAIIDRWPLLFALVALMMASCPIFAQELLTNGGFETGSLSGWTVTNGIGSDPSGGFFTGNNDLDFNLTPPSPATPVSELASVGAKTGSYYAVSDSLGPGTHLLSQTFTVPADASSVQLSFDMFVSDWNGAGALNPNGPLSDNQRDSSNNLIPTEFARVDLLIAGADLFSVAPSDVLENFYLGVDPGTPANDYTHYSFDLTPMVTPGDNFTLRFAEVDNQFTLNQGIDNVSIIASTPEPGVLGLLMGVGIAGSIFAYRRLRSL